MSFMSLRSLLLLVSRYFGFYFSNPRRHVQRVVCLADRWQHNWADFWVVIPHLIFYSEWVRMVSVQTVFSSFDWSVKNWFAGT